MSEEAVIVQIPEGLEVEDLIELKYDSISSSIQLIPVDGTAVAASQNQSKQTMARNHIDMLKLLDASELTNSQTKQVDGGIKKSDADSKKDNAFTPLPKVEIRKNSEGKYECPYCEKFYTQKDNVQRHIKLNHENLYFECDICQASVKNLKQHKRFKHKTGRQEIACVICNKISQSKLASREHLRNDHGEITVPSLVQKYKTCPICNVVLFTKKSLWIAHIYYQHMIPNDYKTCPIQTCKKSISKPDDNFSLKTHLKINHDITVDKIFNCTICPHKSLNEDDLKRHKEKFHPDNSIQCPECNNSFQRFSMMALHLFSVHTAVLRTDGKGPRHKRFNQISKIAPKRDISSKSSKLKQDDIITSASTDKSKLGDIFPRKTKYFIQGGDIVNVEKQKVTTPISPSDIDIKMAIFPELCQKDINPGEFIEKSKSLKNDKNSTNKNELISKCDSLTWNELNGLVPDNVMVAQNSAEGLIIKVDCDQINESPTDVQVIFGLDRDSTNDPKEVIKKRENEGAINIVTEVSSQELFIKDIGKSDDAASLTNSREILCLANQASSEKSFMLTLGGDSEVDLVYKPFRSALNNTEVRLQSVQDDDMDSFANNEEYIVVFDEEDSEAGADIVENTNSNLTEICPKKSPKNIPPQYTTSRRAHSVGNFKCPWPNCTKSFVQKCSVNYHIKNVHMSKEAQCKYCNKTLSNESNLKEHIKSVHERQGSACTWPGCGKILSSKRQMLSHFSKHSEKPQPCTWEGCNSVLRNKNVLRMHIRKVHKKMDPWNEKTSTCHICGITMKTRCLNNHQKTTHTKSP